MKFPVIKKGQPPDLILQAWAACEVESGEVLSREELAQSAALVIVRMCIRLIKEDPKFLEKSEWEVDEIFKKKMPDV